MESQYNFAGGNRRFAAVTLDWILANALAISSAFLIAQFFNVKDTFLSLYLWMFIYIPFYVIVDLFNNVYVLHKLNGQSIGKAIFNEKIISLKSEKLGYKVLLKRWLVFIVVSGSTIGMLLNYYVMTSSSLKQAIHDSVSGTTVVKSKTNFQTRVSLITVFVIALLFSITMVIFSLMLG